MTKNFRQGQILKLIRGRSIFTQDELARALKETNVDATQVTLSRDIRELGLVKTVDGYRELQRETPNLQFATLAAEFLQDAVFGFCRASARGFDDRHFFTMHRMPPNGCFDDAAFPFQNPGGERQIDF